jgi:branched-chain amino acid transport system ATP-binding protein
MWLPEFFQLEHLSKRFGGLEAVSDFSMHVKKGELVGLIGPNGAGKSTVFNLITGIFPPSSGRVVFEDKDITGLRPDRIAALGIGRTFQLNPLFADYSVLENVSSSFHLSQKANLFKMYFNTASHRRDEEHIFEMSLEILRFLGLEAVKDEPARNLPNGYQKMLGMARALATRPRLLLLDEPLGGMNPAEIEFALDAIKKTQDQGMTILMVEHNMQILDLCDRVVVISFGQKICQGLPREVRENPEVIQAYFGGETRA